jgi:hypothetical protein
MVMLHGILVGVFAIYHAVSGIRWWMYSMTDDPRYRVYLNMARSRFVVFVVWHWLTFLIWGIIWLENYNGSNGKNADQPVPGTGAFQFWHPFQALYSLFAMIYASLGFSYAVALASSTSEGSDPSAAVVTEEPTNGSASAARRHRPRCPASFLAGIRRGCCRAGPFTQCRFQRCTSGRGRAFSAHNQWKDTVQCRQGFPVSGTHAAKSTGVDGRGGNENRFRRQAGHGSPLPEERCVQRRFRQP